MAKISQTQRNHMIERVKLSIKKKKVSVHSSQYDPNGVLEKLYSGASTYNLRTQEELLAEYQSHAEFISKHKRSIPKILEKKFNLQKESEVKNNRLNSLQGELIDKLMLGNDLADLQNALIRIEQES